MRKQDHSTQAAEHSLHTLRELFKPHLNLKKARLSCLVMLVLGIIRKRTVSLVWLSQHADSDAKASSIYRRFQRFFAFCTLRTKTVGSLVLALAPRPNDGWVLAMDRTNWQFGKTHINILVVSVLVGRVGLPIAWRVLPKSTKRGNSRKTHRIGIINDVLSILPVEHIRVLTMDREFVGKCWLAWLDLMGVGYVVRLKKNALVGGRVVSFLCERGRWKSGAGKRHEVFGRQVYLTVKKIKKGRDPHLVLISNRFEGTEALELYRQRWGIETLFSHLKKRGYQFEDTHMTRKDRIEKLMGVVALAFALCYSWGRKLEGESATRIKNHGYRAKSIFRRGFESLHRMFIRPRRHLQEIAEFFEVIIRRPLAQNFVV